MMKDINSGLTAEALRNALHYCPETGQWRWLVQMSFRKPAGSMAGDLKPSGYILIGLGGLRYRAHRLAWLYMTGEWPAAQVDHKNNIRSDNSWLNLRLADNQQNQANSRCSKNNKCGLKGAFWNKQKGKWQAKISPNGKSVHLGFFTSASLAHQAYASAAERYFGTFARAA